MIDNSAIIDLKLGETLSAQISQEYKEMAKSQVSQKILDYCHIDNIPDKLIYTHADMTVDLLNYYYANNINQNSANGSGEITAVNLGDMKLTIGNISSSNKDKNAHSNNLDSIIMNYKEILNEYRNPEWGC